MRRAILPAETVRLRVERREPPFPFVRRIEYFGKRVLVAEPKPSRRWDLDIAFKLQVRAPVDCCDLERIAVRAERRGVPFDAALDSRAKAHQMLAREGPVHVFASGRRRLRKERKDGREIGWRRTTTYPRVFENREETVFVRGRHNPLPERVVASVGGLSASQSCLSRLTSRLYPSICPFVASWQWPNRYRGYRPSAVRYQGRAPDCRRARTARGWLVRNG